MSHSIKNKIQRNFEKSWKTYDNHCEVQRKICRHAIELLLRHGNHFNTIADFACGTGLSTQQLVQNTHYEKCYAIDFSNALLNIAKKKCKESRIQFILSDFDDPLFPQNHLDLIFCNMGLQWSLDFPCTLKKLAGYLKNDGLLVFSIPLQKNFPEIKHSHKNEMPTSGEVKNLLMKNNLMLLESSEKSYVEPFQTPFDALRSIKAVGANVLLTEKTTKISGLSRGFINHLFHESNNPTLTYRVGFFLVENSA